MSWRTIDSREIPNVNVANVGAGEYAKAYRLRKQAEQLGGGNLDAGLPKLKPIDRLWLADYMEKHPPPPGSPAAAAYGKSRKGRRVSFELEEAAEAEGTGSAAAEAAGAALMVKAEGERLDSLIKTAVEAMNESRKMAADLVTGWAKMGSVCRKILREQQRDNSELRAAMRTEFLSRVQLEGALEQNLRQQEESENGGDPINALMAFVAAKHLGIPMEALPGVAKMAATMGAPTGKGKGKSNGKPAAKPNGKPA